MTQPTLTYAHIHGRFHHTMHHNSQDYAIAATPAPNTAFGLVLDGCGSKYRDTAVHPSHNETGASLLGSFIAAYLQSHLAKPDCSLALTLAGMETAAANFLHHITNAIPFSKAADRTRFIATHLLTTIVGFIVTPETAVCFWAGDGYLRINNTIIPLHSNNQPEYLAYTLLPAPPSHTRQSGHAITYFTIHKRQTLHTMAAATDGWTAGLLQTVPPVANNLQLQRWLNVQARHRPNFEDDGAIALWQENAEAKK
ncbi:MAG: hypothetical protein Kow0080_11240 [Candidatus Promineifilaceae bacterium]